MPASHRFLLSAGLIAVASAVLAGCASRAPNTLNPVRWITPYRADVIQGNFLSREQVEQLRPGMSRNDVRSVLGTPLLASVFHANRWDYVFTLKRQGVPDQSFRFSVLFEGDKLTRFEGDAMPAEAEFIARMDTRRELGKVPVLQATPEQLEAAAKKSAGKPVTGSAATGPAPTESSSPLPATSYPPLEGPRQ